MGVVPAFDELEDGQLRLCSEQSPPQDSRMEDTY